MDKEKILRDMQNNKPSLSRLVSEMVKVSLNQDYIIPESVFDTEEVLLTNCRINLGEVKVENGSITLGGELFYDVLLLCEDGTLEGVSYSDSFTTSYYDATVTEHSVVLTSDYYVDCRSRLINPRKLNLSSDIEIPLTVITSSPASCAVSGAESIEDEITLQRRREALECVCAVKEEESDAAASLDVELDGNNPPISKILYRHLDLTVAELKARGERVEARLNAQLCIIYLSEEGNRFTFNKNLTLEKSLAVSYAEDYSWSGTVFYRDLTVEPAQNSYGEMKLLELDFTYSFVISGVKNEVSRVYRDFYSTEYECENTSSNAVITKLKRSYLSSLSVNASSTYEEAGVSDVRAVLASSVAVKDPKVSFFSDKKKLLYEATAVINCACENLYINESDKKYSSCRFTYPVRCELDAIDETDGSDYATESSVYGVRCRADGSKLYCDLELCIKIGAYFSTEIEHITEAHLDKTLSVAHTTSAITLCYPSGNESLWDIAKYYRVTIESIISANSLESEDITSKKVLLIPSNKLQKAVF